MMPRRLAGDVLRDAARAWNVPAEQILSPKRDMRTCAARWAVMHALDDMGWSSTKIGQFLNRDHTTVLHGLGRLSR